MHILVADQIQQADLQKSDKSDLELITNHHCLVYYSKQGKQLLKLTSVVISQLSKDRLVLKPQSIDVGLKIRYLVVSPCTQSYLQFQKVV